MNTDLDLGPCECCTFDCDEVCSAYLSWKSRVDPGNVKIPMEDSPLDFEWSYEEREGLC